MTQVHVIGPFQILDMIGSDDRKARFENQTRVRAFPFSGLLSVPN